MSNILTWKDFKKQFGTDTTSNFQLIKWAKQLNIKPFYYVMRDEIKDLPNDKIPIYCMSNIHKKDQHGLHHNCFCRLSPKRDTSSPISLPISSQNYFFDSYGLSPCNEVKDFLKHGMHNEFQFQDFNDKYCGQISLYVLYRLCKGDTFENICLELPKK